MATYIHDKMTNNAREGHRSFATNSKAKTAGGKLAGRGDGAGGCRKVDGLRTRTRVAANFKTAERLLKASLPFGGSKGTTVSATQVARTNTSVGTKDVIRDSAA